MIITTDQDTQPTVAIELTPIIDMVFLLLIFFLIATTIRQTEREMQIALPQARSAVPISAALRELIVNVDAAGKIIVSGRRLDLPELEQLVRQSVEANPLQKVTVRGDRRTAYDNVVRVLDVCKAGGIDEPYLDTTLPMSGNPAE